MERFYRETEHDEKKITVVNDNLILEYILYNSLSVIYYVYYYSVTSILDFKRATTTGRAKMYLKILDSQKLLFSSIKHVI